MTIKELIDIVDGIKPNQYGIGEKVRWLSFVEHTIINDVIMAYEGYAGQYDDFEGYSPDKLDVPLIVKPPHDRLYEAYLKMKIDEENGETARYNNSATMYNTYLMEYKKWYNKHRTMNCNGNRMLGRSYSPAPPTKPPYAEPIDKEAIKQIKENEASIQKLRQSLTNEVVNRENADTTERKARESADDIERAERIREISVERARINAFTRLAEASTTGDAELNDARVDKDGTEHANVGEHIRSVTGQLSGEIAGLIDENNLSFRPEMRNGTMNNIYNEQLVCYKKVEKFDKSFILEYIGTLPSEHKIRFGIALFDGYGSEYGNVNDEIQAWTDAHRLHINEFYQTSNSNKLFVDYDYLISQYPSTVGIACSVTLLDAGNNMVNLRVTDGKLLRCDFIGLNEEVKEIQNYIEKCELINSEFLCFTFENTVGKLNILKSFDGKEFELLRKNIDVESNSEYAFRDPTVFKYKDWYLMVSTRIVGSITDYEYNTGNYFRFSKTKDFVTFEHSYIELPTNFSKVWSPTITKKPNGDYILVFTALYDNDIYSRKTYIAEIVDMESMKLGSINSITYNTVRQDYSDQSMLYIGGYYYIINTVVGKIHLFRSASLSGVFEEIEMNNNWNTQFEFLEGVQILRFANKFVAYMNCPTSAYKGIYYSESTDLINWTDLVKCADDNILPENPCIIGKNNDMFLDLYNAFCI